MLVVVLGSTVSQVLERSRILVGSTWSVEMSKDVEMKAITESVSFVVMSAPSLECRAAPHGTCKAHHLSAHIFLTKK